MSWTILRSRASVMSVLVRTSCSIELIKRLLPRAPAGSVSGSMLISEQSVVKRPLTFESASCGMVRSWHSLRTCICCLGRAAALASHTWRRRGVHKRSPLQSHVHFRAMASAQRSLALVAPLNSGRAAVRSMRTCPLRAQAAVVRLTSHATVCTLVRYRVKRCICSFARWTGSRLVTA